MALNKCMIGAAVLMAAAGVACGQTYTVVDLGSLGGGSAAFAISDAGRIAGYASMPSPDNKFHGFVWDGSMTDAGVLSPSDQTAAFAIDGAGDLWAMGYSWTSLTPQALRYSGGVLTAVANFAPRAASVTGVIAGAMPVTVGTLRAEHACSYQGGVLTDLGTLGGDFSYGLAVNSAGWVVGSSTTARNLQTHACLWIGAAPHDLGSLGGARSQATGINDARKVVGMSDTASGAPHACLWTLDAAGAVISRTDLGVLGGNSSVAYGIGPSGIVVGTSDGRAAIWNGGAPADLNTLAATAAGWRLEVAYGTDGLGRIVGAGSLNGFPRAFMLTCRADFDGTGFIDTDDYDAFVQAFTAGLDSADFDATGFVDTDDFDAFVRAFEAGC